ncbi:hypothetical protein [Acinetobacter courvalinii]|uniref:hypothetical protein n=1 Tax=Acinetobacter courvalinii TaxID=280147 RepID=UPI003F562515
MNEVTVIELSELTGLTRSKIYYLINKGKLIISNGKINLEDALSIITALKIKKTKITNKENFRQILNMLHLQIITLQKQLELAHKREKMYLAELASYRQFLPTKTTSQPPTVEDYTQAELKNDVIDRDENSQKPMEFESENQVPIESCQNSNKETKSANETENHPTPTESICNEMPLAESKSGDTELTRQEEETAEQNDDALIGTSLPNHNDKKQNLILKRRTCSTVRIAKKTKPAKPIYINLTPKMQKVALSSDQPMTDQDDPNNKNHHDPEQ